ncbi:hypothetical protein Q5M87_04940 [Brachyspira innocens]|uniref:Uncharacterized protein n=1 Tax=Brachyspira innocens TaxID=13264 RepID=A0ABT8YVQ0_9SPIR|nr:hypothetical protein [Brachyspira innocens]MDO6993351.1 hypothetical protein [Brachyspira innocens]MDO7019392.1 hypothetical protein [Brachyspira innocens]
MPFNDKEEKKRPLSLSEMTNNDLTDIFNNNTDIKFTDRSTNNEENLIIKGIAVRKDTNYNPLENVSIDLPEHKIMVKTADFTLKPKNITDVYVEWNNANGDTIKGKILSEKKTDTLSVTTFLIELVMEDEGY